jgi:hypothetical protein
MKRVSVELPESVVRRSGGSEESLSRESQFLLALKLFELGRISTVEAAAMCGMNAVDFLLFAERSILPDEEKVKSRVESGGAGVAVSVPPGPGTAGSGTYGTVSSGHDPR